MRNSGDEPIHITVAGSPRDPREPIPDMPGVRVHRGPALHPDDVTVVHGLPVTSISRTLVDLAEILPRDELREVFADASARGLRTWRPWKPPTRESSGAPRYGCFAT